MLWSFVFREPKEGAVITLFALFTPGATGLSQLTSIEC